MKLKNYNLIKKTSSDNYNPFNWANFSETAKNYTLYRKYLGSKIVILNNSNIVFKKNTDGSIDFDTKRNFDDLFLDLKDAGFKINDSDFKSILKSSQIQRTDKNPNEVEHIIINN